MTSRRTEPRPELSVVIPCFNEEENVRAICAAVIAEVERAVDTFEIVLIDNRSTDATRAIIRDLCAEDRRIRAIFNNRNYGQMRSPTHAIFQAHGRAVIGMGADFQDPPALIPNLVSQWRSGAEIVLGQRRSERASLSLRLIRRLGYSVLARIADHPVIPGATGFGLFDRRVVDVLARWNEPEPFFRGMLVESGFRIAVIPFDRPPRAAGESKNSFRPLFTFAMSALSGSARSLLRLPLILSLVAGLMATVLVLGWFAALLAGGPGTTLAWLAIASGSLATVLFSIGLVAEHVRLIGERSRNVPLVIEDERINFAELV